MTVTVYCNWGSLKIRDLHGCPIIGEIGYDCNGINMGNHSESGVENLTKLLYQL